MGARNQTTASAYATRTGLHTFEGVFAITDHTISRDRWGRPLLFPVEGGERVGYTRVSTMSKWLDTKDGLINWSAAMTAIGIVKSKPLQARVAAIAARSDDPYNEAKGALREIVDSATQIAQAQGRADYGTAIHEFSELLDAGLLDWEYVPEKLKGPLGAYQEATECLSVVDTEVFVAVDEKHDDKWIRGAGSLDRLYEHPKLGVVVGDLKTGAKEPQYPLGVVTQVAIYSRGQRYRDASFPGSPAFADGQENADGTAWRKPLHPHLNKSTGLMIHCPLDKVRGKYVCDLYLLDLECGWNNLLLGVAVQAARRPGKLEKLK